MRGRPDAEERWVELSERGRGVSAVARLLDAVEDSPPVEAVEAITRELGRMLGARAVSFLIADLSGRAVVRLVHVEVSGSQEVGADVDADADVARRERRAGAESATVIPFDGGPTEQVVRSQQVLVLTPEISGAEAGTAGLWRVLAPVTERGEVIGLLEFYLPEEPTDDTVVEISSLAHLLAFVVIANGRHTDLFEWGQRTRPLSLSAEIQHRLLPGPQTCEAGTFTLAGWLEPAAGIAGDTFDFSVERDTLHLSITDAMGHGVAAALHATLCVGSLRNARSAGESLLRQVAVTNTAMVQHALDTGLEEFVTGLLGRLDLRTGSLEMVNAGHVAPLLARGSVIAPLELPVHLPMGLFADAAYGSSSLSLEPGDRLVLVTDGMLERNAAHVDLEAAIRDTRALPPRDAVRALADRALEATGYNLRDDATILCLDWHGRNGTDRESAYGADYVPAAGEPVA
jgi:serine phosphatase RsbU (regulator of sigma subunit)